MTAAYGFSITVAMLMTTVLMFYFLRYIKKYPFWIVGAIVTVFVCVETSFFVANAVKLLKRLFFLVFEIGLITTMYVWYNARKMTLKMLSFVNMKDYIHLIEDLSNDTSVPRYATNLVYLTKAPSHKQIEKRVIESIFANTTKRADFYWLINIDRADDPYTMEYDAEIVLKDKIIRVDFRLGFRIQPRIGVMLRKVAEEMCDNNEIHPTARYPTIKKTGVSDFKFVILERFLSYDNEFSVKEGFVLNSYFTLIHLARNDSHAYGIDEDQIVVEKARL